jgi:aspartate--ammonia ligase
MSIKLEQEIYDVKQTFQKYLCKYLKLTVVQSPLFLSEESGLNDHLCSVERPVSFDTKDAQKFEVIHSLAKWKRKTLERYNVPIGQGIVADMRAIRRDEDLDSTHSFLVDQWDYESLEQSEH